MAKKREQDSPVEAVSPTAPAPFTERVIHLLQQWGVVVVGLTAFGYVSGYLVINLYFGSLGIRAPNLMAWRYLGTGILYFVVTFAAYIPIILSLWLLRRENSSKTGWLRRLSSFGRVLVAILIALIMLFFFEGLLTEAKSAEIFTPSRSSEGFWVLFGLGYVLNAAIWLFPFVVMPSAIRTRIFGGSPSQNDSPSWYSYPASVLTAIIVALFSVFLFARLIYPYSVPSYGGGASVSAQLMLDPDSLVAQSLPMLGQDGMTEKVSLVDQSDDGYIILLPDKSIVIVPKDQVRGVLIKP